MNLDAACNVFYNKLRRLTADRIPTPKSYRWGVSWRSNIPGWYHNVWVNQEWQPHILAVNVNRCCFQVSNAQKRRWGNAKLNWRPHDRDLELIIAHQELIPFAAWIVSWIRAVENNDPNMLLPIPYPVEDMPSQQDMLKTEVLWSIWAGHLYQSTQQRT